MQELVYKDFNRLFYANMIVEHKVEEIGFFIKGRNHALMLTLVNEILEILDERDQITPTRGVILAKWYKPNKWV